MTIEGNRTILTAGGEIPLPVLQYAIILCQSFSGGAAVKDLKNNKPEEYHGTANPGLALALSSGGARGYAHIGVLQAMEELGIYPGRVAGTSMGSIVGAAYASGRLPELREQFENLDWRGAASLFIEINLAKGGLLEGRRVMSMLRDLLPDVEIQRLPVAFAAIATDLTSQAEVVIDRGSIVEAVRASIAIPGIFTPVTRQDICLVDGGLINPLPINVALRGAARHVIAVDVNLRQRSAEGKGTEQEQMERHGFLAQLQQYLEDLHSETASGARGLQPLLDNLLRLLDTARSSPTMVEVLTRSFRTAESALTRERLLLNPPDLLIQPESGHIGTLEFQRAEEVIGIGYEAAMAKRNELQKLRDSLNRKSRPRKTIYRYPTENQAFLEAGSTGAPKRRGRLTRFIRGVKAFIIRIAKLTPSG